MIRFERHDDERTCGDIELQFEAAHMTAITLAGIRRRVHRVVPNLRAARRATPEHWHLPPVIEQAAIQRGRIRAQRKRQLSWEQSLMAVSGI